MPPSRRIPALESSLAAHLAPCALAFLAACAGARAKPEPSSLAPAAGAAPARAADPAPVEAAVEAAPDDGALDERSAAAVEHIRAGRLREARAVLSGILVERDLEQARRLVETSPEDALIAIDEVLSISPRHAEAISLKGRASLALAEKAIASGNGSAGVIDGALQDALTYFRRSGEPSSLFGGIRAAMLLGDWTSALELARRGRALLQEDALDEAAIQPPPRHTLSEAFLGAYRTERGAGASAEDLAALHAECEDVFESLLGRTPADPWVWGRLAELYEWAGDLASAQKRLEDGLARAPDDGGLLEQLARVARSAGGPQGSVAALEAHVARRPKDGLGAWLLARERFDRAVERFVAGDRPPTLFDEAEQSFERACELDPARRAAAAPYQVVCRDGRGWCAFHADDLEGAERAFLSMNEVFENGVAWSLPDRLGTGILGLASVADQFMQREDKARAGAIFEEVHGLDPSTSTWANNAGFILREAALDLDAEARKMCELASGTTLAPKATAELRKLAGLGESAGPDDRRRLVLASNERMTRALDLMQRSYKAYVDASALAPEDVRLVNDTAVIPLYYLHTDVERAEAELRSCVEMGRTQIAALEAQLASTELTAEQRDALDTSLYELKNAWGDAHENLGILYLLDRKDTDQARAFFQRALEIGPGERTDITNRIYPVLEGSQALRDSDFFDFVSFGQPCEGPR